MSAKRWTPDELGRELERVAMQCAERGRYLPPMLALRWAERARFVRAIGEAIADGRLRGLVAIWEKSDAERGSH